MLVRAGSPLAGDGLAEPQRRALEAGRVHRIEHAPHPASSTEIRRLLTAGERPPADWLDPAVLDYLLKYGLYRAPDPGVDGGQGSPKDPSPQ
ncbi:MAG: hypothetical protein AAFY88_09125 [Acidobacteriota bacterium]